MVTLDPIPADREDPAHLFVSELNDQIREYFSFILDPKDKDFQARVTICECISNRKCPKDAHFLFPKHSISL